MCFTAFFILWHKFSTFRALKDDKGVQTGVNKSGPEVRYIFRKKGVGAGSTPLLQELRRKNG